MTGVASGAELRRSPPEAARPDRIVRIAVLELDPDAGAGFRQREKTHPAACERQTWHGPTAFLIAQHIRDFGSDTPHHQWVLNIGHGATIFSVELIAHGMTTGSSAPVPSLLTVNLCL